jgi:orotidine-5'-phosphate decarboxylase
MASQTEIPANERLIVALDVPAADQALRAVALLDNVSFFKLGYQLFIAGGLPTLLRALRDRHLFVDLKVPGDISNTIASVIDVCVDAQVRFLTISESMPPAAIRAAAAARDGRASRYPKLLTVPFLSSLQPRYGGSA